MGLLIFFEILHVLLSNAYESVCGNCFIFSSKKKFVFHMLRETRFFCFLFTSREQNKPNKNLVGTYKLNMCVKSQRNVINRV